MDGSASPRNPKLTIRSRPSSGSFEVACRSSARRISSGLIPEPSSATSMSSSPPADQSDSDRPGPSIEGVLNKLLEGARRALYDLASGDAIHEL